MQGGSLSWLFFGFKGRIRRQTFALSMFFLTLPMVLCLYQIGKNQGDPGEVYFWMMVFFLCAALSIWSIFALCVKRLHDFGFPGFISIFGIWLGSFIFFIVLCLWPGNIGANDYGPPPKAND